MILTYKKNTKLLKIDFYRWEAWKTQNWSVKNQKCSKLKTSSNYISFICNQHFYVVHMTED